MDCNVLVNLVFLPFVFGYLMNDHNSFDSIQRFLVQCADMQKIEIKTYKKKCAALLSHNLLNQNEYAQLKIQR